MCNVHQYRNTAINFVDIITQVHLSLCTKTQVKKQFSS